jgi:hypothetical protein
MKPAARNTLDRHGLTPRKTSWPLNCTLKWASRSVPTGKANRSVSTQSVRPGSLAAIERLIYYPDAAEQRSTLRASFWSCHRQLGSALKFLEPSAFYRATRHFQQRQAHTGPPQKDIPSPISLLGNVATVTHATANNKRKLRIVISHFNTETRSILSGMLPVVQRRTRIAIFVGDGRAAPMAGRSIAGFPQWTAQSRESCTLFAGSTADAVGCHGLARPVRFGPINSPGCLCFRLRLDRREQKRPMGAGDLFSCRASDFAFSVN